MCTYLSIPACYVCMCARTLYTLSPGHEVFSGHQVGVVGPQVSGRGGPAKFFPLGVGRIKAISCVLCLSLAVSAVEAIRGR